MAEEDIKEFCQLQGVGKKVILDVVGQRDVMKRGLENQKEALHPSKCREETWSGQNDLSSNTTVCEGTVTETCLQFQCSANIVCVGIQSQEMIPRHLMIPIHLIIEDNRLGWIFTQTIGVGRSSESNPYRIQWGFCHLFQWGYNRVPRTELGLTFVGTSVLACMVHS